MIPADDASFIAMAREQPYVGALVMRRLKDVLRADTLPEADERLGGQYVWSRLAVCRYIDSHEKRRQRSLFDSAAVGGG